MLMEKDRQKRIDDVYKVMRSIDKFINDYPVMHKTEVLVLQFCREQL